MTSEERSEYQKIRRAAIKSGTWTPRPWTNRDPVEQAARRRETARRANANRYIRGRRLIDAAKDAPCVDCGVQLPAECMDLDHVRGTKAFNLCRWNVAKVPAGTTRMEMLKKEIAKCDVRCPNCHRLRHWREG